MNLFGFKFRLFATAAVITDFLLGGTIRSILMHESQERVNMLPIQLDKPKTIEPATPLFLNLYAPKCVDQTSLEERKDIFLNLLAKQLKVAATNQDGQIYFQQTTSPGSLFHLISDFAPGAGWLADPHMMFEKLKNDPRTKDYLPIHNFPCMFSSSQIRLISDVLAEINLTNTNFTGFRSYDNPSQETKENLAKITNLYNGKAGQQRLDAHLALDKQSLLATAKYKDEFMQAAKLVLGKM